MIYSVSTFLIEKGKEYLFYLYFQIEKLLKTGVYIYTYIYIYIYIYTHIYIYIFVYIYIQMYRFQRNIFQIPCLDLNSETIG